MMRTVLEPGAGMPKGLLRTLAAIAGLSVANLYYNQPLLELLRTELHATTLEANRIALFSQTGYALGLFFVVPLADRISRRKIVGVAFALLVVSLSGIAAAADIRTILAFSLTTGVCSVLPHVFIPLAARYSRPEERNRNVGIILSGLLTGILASRVVSGLVGEWWGWRTMYALAAATMALAAVATLRLLPDARPEFRGSYGALMRSLWTLVRRYPVLRLHSLRAALAFGSFLCFWASLAFHMAQPPFRAGSDVVGALGLCGIAGAVTATFAGRFIARVGVRRFNLFGAALQLGAWALFGFGADSYAAVIAGIVAIDIGMQCIQLSNQAVLFDLEPAASNRINTIFMSTFFIGGAFGTLLSGVAWTLRGWSGVVAVGTALTLASLGATVVSKR